jgi:hypothetical protein
MIEKRYWSVNINRGTVEFSKRGTILLAPIE